MALKSVFRESCSSNSCSMLKGRRLSFSPVKSRNSTIVLDSSSDLELIEASFRESPCEFDWIRTPRAARVRHKTVKNVSPAHQNLLEVSNRRQLLNASTSPSRHVSKRRKISDHLQAAIESPLAVALLIESPVPGKNSNHAGIKNKTPPVENYLAGSKRRNVEAWLTSTSQKTRPALPRKCDSPFDPKVEEVLKSVYGNVWLKKAIKKCKTDVKAAQPTEHRRLASETKESVLPKDYLLESPRISKPARRKIFDSPQILKETDVAPVTEKKKAVRKPRKNVSIEELPSTPKSLTAAPSSSTPQQNSKSMMTPRRTFLSSLAPTTPTSVSHPEATDYKKHFKKKKDELAAKLFKMYNSNVFDNRLPEDMSVTWNPRMRGTAGFCYCKRKRDRKGVITREARIVLSPKVIDRADRLRDTLIHEMCHAAAWLIDGVVDNHGPLWTEWTRKVRLRFPELPVIKRCHSYDIDSKFVYKCTKCGYCIKRHSKSLDVERKRCGKCLGPFELFAKKKKPGSSENPGLDLTKTMRAPNAFALFVKENYKVVKETHPEMKHPQIMKVISAQYAVYKSVVTPNKN